MSDALKACGRPIVFSICEWGQSKPWLWGEEVGNLWRTTADIRDYWECELNWGGLGCLNILDKQVGLEDYAGPGHWNDPDMLEVGNGGMNFEESKTHFGLWCMLAAPLMAGNDLRTMDEQTKVILTNKDMIAINQDTLGIQGFKFLDFGDQEIWVKPLANQNLAICFLNRDKNPFELSYNWKKEAIYKNDLSWNFKKKTYNVYDVWLHKNTGTTEDVLKCTVPGHSAIFLRLIPQPERH
jgi:alpha-galactosidase